MVDDATAASAPAPTSRKPRKRFLLIGVVAAAALGIGLFTSAGTSPSTTHAPREGGHVPSFSAAYLNGTGRLSVSGGGTPLVLTFFGNWCPGCHQELPPLAAAISRQRKAGGALSHVRVIGIDNEDTVGDAKAFIKASGVTFPVAYDPDLSITEGSFFFRSDPETVFVKADGTISRIVFGDNLTPTAFTAYERALIPSGN